MKLVGDQQPVDLYSSPRRDREDFPARPREDLESLFKDGGQGFSGGDGNLSIDIGSGRSLWLFGDTLIGPRDDPDRLSMPKNTVGILQNEPDRGWYFTYYWRQDTGRPTAFFPPDRKGEWLWPGTACHNDGKIFLFLRRIGRDSSKILESFRFRYLGPKAIVVPNSGDSPDRWKLNPIANTLAKGVVWGSACHAGSEGYLYVWGYTTGRRKKGMVTARHRLDRKELESNPCWEYLRESREEPVWSEQGVRLKTLFDDTPSEISLSYLEELELYLAVYGNHKTNRIGYRVSRSILGPWSPFRTAYIPPEPEWDSRYFCYAPKAHPEMGFENDEIVLTYATNAYEVRCLIEDERIYYPRFIALPLDDIRVWARNL